MDSKNIDSDKDDYIINYFAGTLLQAFDHLTKYL